VLLSSSPVFGGVRVFTYISNTASFKKEVGTVYPAEGEAVPASYKTLAVLLIYVITRIPPKTGDEHRSS
jgi:hypothetical protein